MVQLQIEERPLMVHSIRDTRIWIKLIEGRSIGHRVSVPRYSTKYTEELENRVNNLEAKEVYNIGLISDKVSPPQWRIDTISDYR